MQGTSRIMGLVFDKDGTLFDFQATWSRWSAALIDELAQGNAALAGILGRAIGFDPADRSYAPDSPVIAGTPDDIARCLLPHLPQMSLTALVTRMNLGSAQADLSQAVPLVPLFDALRARGLRIGLATNDAEAPARAHLEASGVAGHFDFVAGFDSGFGGKPEPGMLLAFSRAFGLAPAQVAMVGDSRHDLIAGRAAGMVTLGVLTGLATAQDLLPLADAVLPDIGHLPGWLDGTVL